MISRHGLSPDLDRRLLSYASTSWNSYEAVFNLQQLAALIPAYTRDLESIYGRAGVGDARRAWGVVADLVSAMAGVPPTMETLVEFGFEDVTRVDHIIAFGGGFSLATSPVLRRLDFRAAILGDITPVLKAASAHDAIAKPLLEKFQEEIRAYDLEAASASHDDAGEFCTFRDLVRQLPDLPDAFPMWDSRPMFLDEQKAMLDYLAKHVGAEIVADSLVDEPLGEFLLRSSGIIRSSDVTGEVMFELNLVPHRLLDRPVELVCHQAGNAVLNALLVFDPDADVLDRLFVVESTIRKELDLDVSTALASTRQLTIELHMREFVGMVVDVTDGAIVRRARLEAQPFEFPDLSSDA